MENIGDIEADENLLSIRRELPKVSRLESIANSLVNSRTRLSHPFKGAQSREDIISEAKRLGQIENRLLGFIDDFRCHIDELKG